MMFASVSLWLKNSKHIYMYLVHDSTEQSQATYPITVHVTTCECTCVSTLLDSLFNDCGCDKPRQKCIKTLRTQNRMSLNIYFRLSNNKASQIVTFDISRPTDSAKFTTIVIHKIALIIQKSYRYPNYIWKYVRY